MLYLSFHLSNNFTYRNLCGAYNNGNVSRCVRVFIIAFMTTRKGETNEKLSNGELVSDNLVWLYNGIQCSFETLSFGRELSDLWNVNAPLLNGKK